MKKFLVIYHAPVSAEQQMQATNPDDMKKIMEEWKEWGEKCGEKLVDFGTPLSNGQKIDKSGSSNAETGVVGYSIMQGESMDQVVEMLKDHPHLNMPGGCEIEVYESLPVPGME